MRWSFRQPSDAAPLIGQVQRRSTSYLLIVKSACLALYHPRAICHLVGRMQCNLIVGDEAAFDGRHDSIGSTTLHRAKARPDSFDGVGGPSVALAKERPDGSTFGDSQTVILASTR
jgi:hypothetical protein